MAFSLAAAIQTVAARGKGVTLGRNKGGGIILVQPGRLTLAEVLTVQSEESKQFYGPIVSVEVK